MMHGRERSDLAVVAMKLPNNAGQPVTEAVEPRAGTKGNVGQQSTHRTQIRERVSQALDRVRQAATRLISIARSLICTVESTVERTGPNRPAGHTYRRRTGGKGRWRSPPWKTRLSRVRLSWC